MSTNGNESAFPWTPTNAAGQCSDCVPGLTKRELFAAMAMQAIASTEEGSGVPATVTLCAEALGIPVSEYRYTIHYPQVVALTATRFADALIAELSKSAQ